MKQFLSTLPRNLLDCFKGRRIIFGFGISMTIHWFSDFAAGAIIGSAIGAVVGKSFWRSLT